MKSFPKPLNEIEEAEVIERCRRGDKAARATLIERNLRLVVHIVKRYSIHEYELEDLISIGTIGLIKAIDSFNEGKKIKLATYASKCIDNELLMFLRNSKKLSREVYLQEPIGSDKEGNEVSLIDIIEAVDIDVLEQMELKENVMRLHYFLKKVLNDREKEIIFLRYGLIDGNEVTQREIATKLGISRSYVSRIEKKALGKLRDVFGK